MYNCNALNSLYVTLVTAAGLHWSGIFRLTEIIDNYGHLMSVAMIYGFSVSLGTYLYAVLTNTHIRTSGNFFYDYFMGACLNPRIGSIDLKMWGEVRIPWVIVFFLAVSGGCKQYEQYGYVTPVCSLTPRPRTFLTLHIEYGIHDFGDRSLLERLVCFLFHITPPTTKASALKRQRRRVHSPDLGYVSREVLSKPTSAICLCLFLRRWGFLVIFWNLAGVPFVSIFRVLCA